MAGQSEAGAVLPDTPPCNLWGLLSLQVLSPRAELQPTQGGKIMGKSARAWVKLGDAAGGKPPDGGVEMKPVERKGHSSLKPEPSKLLRAHIPSSLQPQDTLAFRGLGSAWHQWLYQRKPPNVSHREGEVPAWRVRTAPPAFQFTLFCLCPYSGHSFMGGQATSPVPRSLKFPPDVPSRKFKKLI